MRPAETIAKLSEFRGRGAGSDAERRAARWLSESLRAGGRDARLEPFWCRPNWALAHAWHAALGIGGSLLSVSSPRVGGGLLLVALVSVIADAVSGFSLGRRLTPERASQNVVAAPPDQLDPEPVEGAKPLRLVITANYDAGRMGLAYRDRPRAAAARLRRASGGLAPGWLGWLTIALVWLLVIAILRLDGNRATSIGVAQLIPTVGLVLALALLLDLGSARYGPAAGDNASGTAVVLALARALDVAPPRRMAVEIVLQGAGDGGGLGLRRYLRARRGKLDATNTVVLGIAPCGFGSPHWWISDGALVPVGYFHRLRELSAAVSRDGNDVIAAPHRGRGTTPALPARSARLPAVAIGCLDARGLAPRSHQPGDTSDAIDPGAIDAAVEFGLIVIDAIDGFLGRDRTRLHADLKT